MSKFQITSLSLKLAGIYSIIQAIPILKFIDFGFFFKNSNYFATNSDKMFKMNYLFIGTFTSFFLLLLVGAILIIFSQKIAKKITKGDEDNNSLSGLSAKDISSIAFSVIGVILIVIAIPKLVQVGANIQFLKQAGDEMPTRGVLASTWAYSIGLIVQIIIGLLLFFGARGLSTIWCFLQKIRPMKDNSIQ